MYCLQPTPDSPTPCHWPRGECPIHDRDQLALEPPEPEDLPPGLPPRELGLLALERTSRLETDPLETARFLRGVHAVNALPLDEEEETLALRKAIVHGRAMHGLPPETPEQWKLAYEMFDEEDMREILRWQRVIDHILETAANEARDAQENPDEPYPYDDADHEPL